jgi:serine/threonine protein kinase
MHRDIKPSNLVITDDGVLKILDFDLSEFFSENVDLKYSVSTKGYKPPELLLKQKKYDYRIDVYASGCIMLAMLFGKAPYFSTPKDMPIWLTNAEAWGIDALIELDYNGVISNDDIYSWNEHK